MKAPPTVTEELLHALADERLPAPQAAALLVRLDADTLRTVRQWQAQRQALRQRHADLPDEPPSPALVAAATRLQARRDRHQARWRLGGTAAAVALAFASGWLVHGQVRPTAAPAVLAEASPGPRFAHAATSAHALFQPEVRHPVEVPASEQEHLQQWLSKRLGHPLHAPDLQGAGYVLMGGRLLPGDGGGARAQFMYEDPAGERVTVYVGALAHDQGDADATAFRFQRDGAASAFYWVDRGLGYALAGELPRERLQALAVQVHRQLQQGGVNPRSRAAPVSPP